MNEKDRITEPDLEAIRQRAHEIERAEGKRPERKQERRARSSESSREEGEERNASARSRNSDVERSSEDRAAEPVERQGRADRDRARRAPWRPFGFASEPYGPRDAGKYQFGGGYMGYPGSASYPFYAAPQAMPGYLGGPHLSDDPREHGHREHDHHVFGNWADAGGWQRNPVWTPRTEMFDRDGKLIVRVELPGMDREDVDVSLEGDRLVIEGERHEEDESRGREGFYRSEWSYGFFHREIPLPEPVEHDHVKAKFKDGVLEVAIPQPDRESGRKQIRIDS